MELILENLNLVQILISTYWQLENKEFGGKWYKQTPFSSIPKKGGGELGRVHCVSLKVPYWQLENKEFGGKWYKQTTFSSIPKKR